MINKKCNLSKNLDLNLVININFYKCKYKNNINILWLV